MNRAYNDNNEYTNAMSGLRFSDEAKARMVQRLLDAQEQAADNVVSLPRARKRRWPRIAAVSVAAAVVLTVGASATGVLKTAGEAFAGVFGPTADTEVIDKIGRPVGASDTSGGVTVTADAILFDGYNYMLAFSVAKDDGTPFDVETIPDTNGKLDLFWDRWSSDIGLNTSGGHGGSYFYDEDPEDAAIQYVETMSYDEAVKTGGTVKMMFGDLRNMDETIAEGTWNLKFKLEAGDLSTELPAGQTFALNGMNATIDKLVISPIGYYLRYTVDEEADFGQAQSGRETEQQERELSRFDVPRTLRCKDGTETDLMTGGGSMKQKDGNTICVRADVFGAVIPLEDIESITVQGIEIPVQQS